jgi:hypothetical protein
VVYYGAINEKDELDTTQEYTSRDAFYHGFTSCKNEYFGLDPLPGVKKYCFCDELKAHINDDYQPCAKNGEKCKCEVGGSVIMGQLDETGLTFDFKKDHTEIDADISGTTPCVKDYFFMGSNPNVADIRNP